MNVLFVCHANVGRSQVAQAHFERLSRHDSDCAGIAVDELVARHNIPGKKMKDLPNHRPVKYIRKTCDVDIAEKERQQLTRDVIDRSDLVIVIAEPTKWPNYLGTVRNKVFWNIPDPQGQNDCFAFNIYRQIQHRVERLVEQIG